LVIPTIDVEAINNPIADTRIPVTARNSCFRDRIGFSSASMIKKKTTEENDTNENTTKTRFETNKNNMISTDPAEQIPERNPSLENVIFRSMIKAGIIPQNPDAVKMIRLTIVG